MEQLPFTPAFPMMRGVLLHYTAGLMLAICLSKLSDLLMRYLLHFAARCSIVLNVLLLLLYVGAPQPVLAQATDQTLLDTVQQFLYQETQTLGQEVVIDIAPPSPHLPPCLQPSPFLPNANQAPIGRVSVGVRCGEDGRQTRYLQAQVDVIGRYIVAGQDIARGTLITSSMLAQREGNLSDLSSQSLTSEEDVVGKVAQRPIRSGSTFQAHFLQAPSLVERGQRVTVIAEGSGFRVSREGEALTDGAEGETIRVRFGPRDIMNARVIGQGTLMVDF
jgi:flagella basal body P-ring formation protein FlgA|tara:strand:- start:1740 stop:2567 length:828 start_codon:yes stop_codon:yes gene_type:complete